MSRSHSNYLKLGAIVASMMMFIVAATLSASGDESTASKATVSVPAEDLANQLHSIVARLDDLLAKPDEFDDARKSRIAKEAGVAAVAALGLGLSEPDYPLKRSASSALAAAQALAKTRQYPARKQAPP